MMMMMIHIVACILQETQKDWNMKGGMGGGGGAQTNRMRFLSLSPAL
jgi:hypothetical protein